VKDEIEEEGSKDKVLGFQDVLGQENKALPLEMVAREKWTHVLEEFLESITNGLSCGGSYLRCEFKAY
jgi:hypothetical protein